MKVLVTGGAGFIGTHLCHALLKEGHEVRALDALVEQVHGPDPLGKLKLSEDVEFLHGNVLDPLACRAAVRGVDVVYHLAAYVGVGQSAYERAAYVQNNIVGTTTLLDEIQGSSVRRLVVASSMSVYGEGRLERGLNVLDPLHPCSIYAITKLTQEQIVMQAGQDMALETVALRYFNTYGPGQALDNPYTGVVAIFLSRHLAGQPLLIFEDGEQTRDFVHVDDITQANVAALDADVDGEILNVGTGYPTSLNELINVIGRATGSAPKRQHAGYRQGDIRHAYAEIGRTEAMLGYRPNVPLYAGITSLVQEVGGHTEGVDSDRALKELQERGLVNT